MRALVNQRQLLTDRALQCAAAELDVDPSDLQVTPVSGGFSRNRRALVSAGAKTIFVKEVDIDVLPGEGERELGWLKKDYEVICFWYDPNIHPKSEHDKRLAEFIKVCEIEQVEYIS